MIDGPVSATTFITPMIGGFQGHTHPELLAVARGHPHIELVAR